MIGETLHQRALSCLLVKLPFIGDVIKSPHVPHAHRPAYNAEAGFDRTYQLHTGGNTGFLKILNRKRMKSEKAPETVAVLSVAVSRIDDRNINVVDTITAKWVVVCPVISIGG